MENVFLTLFLAPQKTLNSRIMYSNKTSQMKKNSVNIVMNMNIDYRVIKYRLFKWIISCRNFRLSKFPL